MVNPDTRIKEMILDGFVPDAEKNRCCLANVVFCKHC